MSVLFKKKKFFNSVSIHFQHPHPPDLHPPTAERSSARLALLSFASVATGLSSAGSPLITLVSASGGGGDGEGFGGGGEIVAWRALLAQSLQISAGGQEMARDIKLNI